MLVELYVRIVNWIKEQKGQDLVEYAVLLALIALVVWAMVSLGGKQVNSTWSAIVGGLQSITTAASS